MSEELKQKRAKAEAFCADNLRECAAELIEWQNNTALLRDGKVRELAALCGEYAGGFDGGYEGLKVAERMIQNQACERVAASTSPARPGDVPIPTSADMAELMEKVGYSYLQTYAPERLKSTSPASDAELPPLPDEVIFGASRFGTVFKGYTADQMNDRYREGYRAALASTRTASDTRTAATDFPSIERAAEYLEHYAQYLQEVKLEDIERHPYIPSIQEAAEELRAIINRTASTDAAAGAAAGGNTCPKCRGTGIETYHDHGAAQFGEQAIEPIRCEKCDGFGHAEVDVEAERKRFESWMVSEAKIIVGSTDPYPAGLERDYWRVWQAAARTQADAGKAALRTELLRLRDWFESQAKIISKGCGSTWDMGQCRDQIESIDAMLTSSATHSAEGE